MSYKIINFLFQVIAVKQYLIFSGMFFLLTAFVMIVLNAQLMPPACPGMIPLELAFSPSVFGDIVSKCGAEGVKAHIVMIWVDYIFILGYAGFMANLLGSLVKHIDYSKALMIFSLPVLAGVLDVFENTLLLIQLSNYETLNSVLILTASTAALIKFILIAASIIAILYYLYMQISGKETR